MFFSLSVNAQEKTTELDWPIELESENGFITTLYQPQLEGYNNNQLSGRMAVTIKPPEDDMIFGALWFKARLTTDLEDRTVLLEEVDILKVHFPEMIEQKKIDKFKGLLIERIESKNIVMSLDLLMASLEEVEDLNKLSDQIKNDPPVIYFRNSSTILVMIDGDPIIKKDEDANLEYVVNTPFFIVKESKKDDYYINGGEFWYI